LRAAFLFCPFLIMVVLAEIKCRLNAAMPSFLWDWRMVAICYHSTMSQPVKLSDGLVLDARLAGEVMERSIAGQVEFWARLGRSIEPLLRGDLALSLCRNAQAKPLSACLASVDSPDGQQRLQHFLGTLPFPHYEPHPTAKGLLIQVEENGSRTPGRFVSRKFVPSAPARKTPTK
jgi:ParD-like antitoxin of type II bacterial toxin-antitoxin system